MPTARRPTRYITARVPTALVDDLRAVADASDRSCSAVVRIAIGEYIGRVTSQTSEARAEDPSFAQSAVMGDGHAPD